MKLHYYRCTDNSKIPVYDTYDYAQGIVGFKARLKNKAVEAKYLGHWTEQQLADYCSVRHVKASPIRARHTANTGEEGRY